MDNIFLILQNREEDNIVISKFHLCSWDISSKKQYLEIGLEISKREKEKEIGKIYIVAPWIKKGQDVISLHKELSIQDNASFIFNDGVTSIKNPSNASDNWKTIVFFSKKEIDIIEASITVDDYALVINPHEHINSRTPQYVRLLIPITGERIAKSKWGISQRTKIYDIKVNEKRNLDEKMYSIIREKKLDYCRIMSAYFLHVIPSKSEMMFSSNYLIKLRCLEKPSFENYLGAHVSIKKKDYFITFNKVEDNESYSSFCEFKEEIIGMTQIVFAVGVNLLCSIIWTVLELLWWFKK